MLRAASYESLSGSLAKSETSTRRNTRGKGGQSRRKESRGKMRAVSSSSGAFPTEQVLEVWRTSDAVAFDVDSTVCIDEGIDELGVYVGAGEKVARITKEAMEGGLPFGEALQRRLEAMAISRELLESYVKEHPPKFSPGIKELVAKLHAQGKDVHLISGGFRQMIAPVATELGIPSENVHANTIVFNEDGSLKGFDDKEFTSRAGGKADAVKFIKSTKGYKHVVMIGDGATDLEARVSGGADIVIGYGGAQRREKVVAESDWFVTELDTLVNAL